MNRQIITPSDSDLRVFSERMAPFRDSGCRIILPVANFEKVLVSNLSGHYVFAPSERTRLGFLFDPSTAIKGSTSPLVKQYPYSHCPDLSVHIDHNDYLFYFTPESADSKDSLVRGHNMYGLDVEFLLNQGSFVLGK